MTKEVNVMAKKASTRKLEKAPRPSGSGMSPWEEMERWLERTGRHGWMRPGLWEWPPHLESLAAFRNGAPKVDVIDRDAEVVVRAELPGVAKEDLDVTVTGNSVTLKAHTSHEEQEEKGEYYRREMSYGEYQRTVALPHAVDGEKARATFDAGVLELTLPKVEKTSRKKVTVE
jgi:HSP20 family protein